MSSRNRCTPYGVLSARSVRSSAGVKSCTWNILVDKTTRRSIAAVLADAQARLRRLSPGDAAAAMSNGWTLVDTRDADVISRDGAIPGALRIPLSVLEWRVDPTSETHSAELTGREERLILICRDGYSSSLAAVRLHELGLTDTTDVIGGFGGWVAAGLPVDR